MKFKTIPQYLHFTSYAVAYAVAHTLAFHHPDIVQELSAPDNPEDWDKETTLMIEDNTVYLHDQRAPNAPTFSSVADFLKAMTAEQLMVGEHEVKTGSDGVRVGCKSATWEEVERILALRGKPPVSRKLWFPDIAQAYAWAEHRDYEGDYCNAIFDPAEFAGKKGITLEVDEYGDIKVFDTGKPGKNVVRFDSFADAIDYESEEPPVIDDAPVVWNSKGIAVEGVRVSWAMVEKIHNLKPQ